MYEMSPYVISSFNTVPERKSTGYLTETMVIGDIIINKGDIVYVFSYISDGNNIPSVIGWVKKIDRFNNVLTTISVKLDVDGFIYHNITLKGVTNVDILNRIYSESQITCPSLS